jgi:hypothetical protein
MTAPARYSWTLYQLSYVRAECRFSGTQGRSGTPRRGKYYSST